jgi:hypothetical protein
VAADLLKLHRIDGTLKKGAHPLAMEFSVSPESAPHLVTAAGRSGLIWIPNEKRRSTIRSAFREQTLASLFLAIVDEVAITGAASRWGNCHPFTAKGVAAAVEHVRYYGIEAVELLIPPDPPSWISGLPHDAHEAGWLAGQETVIAVAAEREYLGFSVLSGASILALVHNPSRGMAVAR